MTTQHRIDTHAHIVPDFYTTWLAEKDVDAGGLPLPDWSVDAALEFMAANGIDTSILSISTPGVEPGARAEAATMARRLNDYSASVVQQHPGKFGFFATLPLPDVEAALKEAEYALDSLGADGVVLHAHAGGAYLGEPVFDELFTELNRRGTVIFIHPSELPDGPVAGIPAFMVDFLLDSVRAAISLMRSGTMTRCPDIKVILSHAGGFLPFVAARIATRVSPTGDTEDGYELLRRFYLDTALASSPVSLPCVTAFADPTRLTYGSDFPYAPAARSSVFTRQLDDYDAIDHRAVNRKNAEQLFPRLASAA